MFYANKIKSIKEKDKVLEIGPGSLPHSRSDVFLELSYDDEEQAKEQRGNAEKIDLNKPVIYYDGRRFPFEDNEFDYIICSHVLEHVDDVDYFISELKRVAPKGYIEYPRIYYDYLYNYNCHKNFILKKDNNIQWITKSDVNFEKFYPVHTLFYDLKHKNHFYHFERDLMHILFEGYEWDRNNINSIKVNNLKDVCLEISSAELPEINIEELYKQHFYEYIDIIFRELKRKPLKFLPNLLRGKYARK